MTVRLRTTAAARTTLLSLACLAMVLLASASNAQPQDAYPSRLIKWVVA